MFPLSLLRSRTPLAISLLLVTVISLSQTLAADGPTVQAASPGSRVSWGGGSWYLQGANVPWYNWACDFGCGSNGGVSSSSSRTALASRFAQAQANGMHVLRWWTFEGDAWQINRDGQGAPSSLNSAVYADFDTALQLADQYDLYYNFVLFSGASAIPSAWLNDGTQRAKLAAALTPLFDRYKSNPRVLSWEIFNEPDFDVWNNRVGETALRSTIKAVADAVHANSPAYVTVGMGFADGLYLVTGLGLDYYQAHWYDYMGGGTYCMRCNTYNTYKNQFSLDAPLVVGEMYAGSDTDALQRFEDFYAKGYAGVWSWSLFPEKTADQMGTDLAAMKTFTGRHSDVGPRGSGSTPPTATQTLVPTATATSTATATPPTATATATAPVPTATVPTSTPGATSTPRATATAVAPTATPRKRNRRPIKVRFATVQSATTSSRPQSTVMVTVTASTSAEDPSNSLLELRFAPARNATVDVGEVRGQRDAFTYRAPHQTLEMTFSVTRIADGPFFVPFTVVDQDGEWTTFVGEGR